MGAASMHFRVSREPRIAPDGLSATYAPEFAADVTPRLRINLAGRVCSILRFSPSHTFSSAADILR